MTWGNLVPAAAVIQEGLVFCSVVRCITSEGGLTIYVTKIPFIGEEYR